MKFDGKMNLTENKKMLRHLKHIRFAVQNDRPLSSGCYWCVPAATDIDPLGFRQNSIGKQPSCART